MARKLWRRFFCLGCMTSALSFLLALLYIRLLGDQPAFSLPWLFFWLLGLLLLLWLLAALSTVFMHNVLRPLEAVANDLDELERSVPYPELLPFIEALRQRQVQKEENVRQRQEFSANVSHELKTPLTSISGYAEMIETGMAREEDVKEFAGKIHAEAGRLIDLIRDIIKLSELDEPQQTADLAPLDLLPIVQDTAGLLDFAAQRAGVDIAVQGVYGQVFGKRELLEELVYNLCDNAIRYNRPGGWVRVRVSALPGGGMRLVVADNGIGIPDEHQERIFERFYRADKSRSKASGGTGLGLAIVKHIVLQHGAQLALQSEVGRGTEIAVDFPPPEQLAPARRPNRG